MIQEKLDTLNERGWIELENYSDESSLLKAANEFGEVVKHSNRQEIFSLHPKENKDAMGGTFSNLHGLNEFPLHTDTAFLNFPVRYMMLNAEKESSCGTKLLATSQLFRQLSEAELKIARRSIFLLKTKNRSCYLPLFFKHKGQEGFRYDSTCMTPFNNHAKDFVLIMKNAFNRVETSVLKWNQHKTILIDNWKTLHGREAVRNGINRELKRIYINTL
ncbi:TauD/TfdA family dioxygenase [Ekhidna sp.]